MATLDAGDTIGVETCTGTRARGTSLLCLDSCSFGR
jgi:hypothetical protein